MAYRNTDAYREDIRDEAWMDLRLEALADESDHDSEDAEYQEVA